MNGFGEFWRVGLCPDRLRRGFSAESNVEIRPRGLLHAGEVELLPALPAAWSRGAVRGLRARGAFEFTLAWEEGRLASAAILAHRGGTVTVRHAGASATYTLGM